MPTETEPKATDISVPNAALPTPSHPLQEIVGIHSNQRNLRLLEQMLIKGKGVLPFVGAGLSKPHGFALWREFLREQGKNANIEPQIEARIANGEYEEVADDLFQAMGRTDFHEAVDEEYGLHKLDGKQIAGAHAYLIKIVPGPVITTNFDRVLETAFMQGQSEFVERVWGARAQLVLNGLTLNERMLFKIHGDVRDNDDRILTQNEYQTHYGGKNGLSLDMNKPLPRLLHLMLLHSPLLFVGCSLNNDRTLKVMRQLADEFNETRHWAIVEMPKNDAELLVRQKFLSEHNIRPIWYPNDHHEFVEQILKYLADQLPPP